MNGEETGPFRDPDVQLMLRVRDGDEEAFAELVRRHRRNVLNLVYRYLGDAAAAEDAAQDVFVKVHRARHKYAPAAKFSTWLYRIAVNHCLNLIRARKARPAVAEAVEDLVEHPSAEDPDARATRLELQEAVKSALQELPPQQRLAVLLARFEELSYNEIAETMDLSLEAVKSLLFRAKENLQRLLGRYAKM
jgi:RNA polymerase sigma-70 factor (ECF subfamily)